jgi:hypothetical protein
MLSAIDLGSGNQKTYLPGVCNIGPAEIRRRRRSGHAAVVVSVALLAILLVIGAPAWTRLILVVTAGGAATAYLQARLHFCAGYGSRGIYNFGPLGTVERVLDPQALSRDRMRALQIGLVSLAVGLIVGGAAVLLPIS